MIRHLRTVAMVIALAAPAFASMGVSSTYTTTLAGQYIFRGAKFGPTGLMAEANFVKPLSSQLSARADLWSYTRFAGPGAKRVQELDYTAEMTWTPSKLFSLTGGWVYYDVLHGALDGEDTAEVYGGVNFNLPGSPGITAYYNYDGTAALRGLTAIGHAGYSDALGKSGWTGSIYGELGLRAGPAGATGLIYGDVRTGLSYDLGSGVTFGPTVDFWFPSAAQGPDTKKHFRTVLALGFGYSTHF